MSSSASSFRDGPAKDDTSLVRLRFLPLSLLSPVSMTPGSFMLIMIDVGGIWSISVSLSVEIEQRPRCLENHHRPSK